MPDEAKTSPPRPPRPQSLRERTVLIVDDSVTARSALKHMITNQDGWRVAGTAADGEQALEKIRKLDPDIVVMDFEMPVMNGLEAIRELRTFSQVPVLVLSGNTPRASRKAMVLFAAGASEVMSKHPTAASSGMDQLKDSLMVRLNALTGGSAARAKNASSQVANVCTPRRRTAPLIVVGASTGGPPALELFLDALPASMTMAVVIAQHMPEMFTKALSERLNERGTRQVHLAQNGLSIEPGCVYIAPGGAHTKIHRTPDNKLQLQVDNDPADAPYRPSVDALFSSAARCVGANLLAAVLTGMGDDGLRGARDIVAAGGKVAAQDEASCVVYGMPRAVIEAGLATAAMPPKDLAACLSQTARQAG